MMRFKVLSLLILLSILLVLAGCDADATPVPTATATQVAVVPSNTSEPIDAPTSAATATADPTDIPPTATATEEPPTATPVPTEEPTPVSVERAAAAFVEAACPFDLPAGQEEGQTVECGYLEVPENRQNADSSTIRLAVAVFWHPDGSPEPDPIIYLEGGPGGSALEFIDLSFDSVHAPMWEANRDIVVFDQRGVGLSEPALDCPEIIELSRELLDSEIDGEQVGDDEVYDLSVEAILACQEDLSAVADLSAYNTIENAADVDDLRQALGYDQVNLWGVSYGTRLALEVMRQYPEGLRSVVLDSVYPPEVNLFLDTPASVDRAFDTLFDACAADEACNTAYPDLEGVFYDTVERLNAEPVDTEIVNAFTGETYDAVLNGDDLQAFVFQFLYYADVIPSLPGIVYDASEGELGMVARLLGVLIAQQEAMSQGMHLSVQCHDEAAKSSLEEFESVLAEYPELSSLFEDSLLGRLGYEVCQAWGAGEAGSAEDEPVSSDIPALVLAGEYDPITPPAWGELAAESLSTSYFFEFPGVGHGATVSSDCARAMMLGFLDDPTAAPDDACLTEMSGPEFAPSSEGVTVELEPFTNEQMGISGLVPVGWDEISPGAYARQESALDAAVLLMQSGPFSAADLLELLTSQLGLEEVPEATGRHEAGELTWTLYSVEIQGIAVDLALAEAGDTAFIVLLQSNPDEREALYDSVLVPVLDALAPAP